MRDHCDALNLFLFFKSLAWLYDIARENISESMDINVVFGTNCLKLYYITTYDKE